MSSTTGQRCFSLISPICEYVTSVCKCDLNHIVFSLVLIGKISQTRQRKFNLKKSKIKKFHDCLVCELVLFHGRLSSDRVAQLLNRRGSRVIRSHYVSFFSRLMNSTNSGNTYLHQSCSPCETKLRDVCFNQQLLMSV